MGGREHRESGEAEGASPPRLRWQSPCARATHARSLRPRVQKPLTSAPVELKVRVVSHPMQRYAVWFGGSMLTAVTHEFYRVCHTKAQYMEEGPRIARHNAVFQATM